MREVAVLAGLLVAPLLVGCLSADEMVGLQQGPGGLAATPPAIPVATDQQGDARTYGPQTARAFMHPTKCAVIPSPVRPNCWEALGALREAYPAPSGDGAVYEPALDVLSATMRETPESLVVEISVAALEAWAPAVVASDASYTGGWRACWQTRSEAEEAWECAYLSASMGRGALVVEGLFERDTFACNSWGWCAWNVPFSIAYGTPATLQLTIPRSILGTGESGDTLEGVLAGSWRSHHPGGGGLERVKVAAGVGDIGEEDLDVRNWYYYPTDETMETKSFTFETPRAPEVSSGETPRFDDAAGDGLNAQTDILSVAIVETPASVTVAVQVAQVENRPENHEYFISLGVPNGAVPMAGYVADDGDLEAWASGCGEPECNTWVDLPVELVRSEGAPGWVNVTLPRWGLGSPGRGGVTNTVIIDMSYRTGYAARPANGPGRVEFTVPDDSDGVLLPPYWFRMDTA